MNIDDAPSDPNFNLEVDPEEDSPEGLRQNQSYKSFDQGYRVSGLNLSQDLFDRFKQRVFAARPNIAHIQKTYGHLTFYEYTRTHTIRNKSKIAKQRRPQLIQTVRNEVKELLGTAIADSVGKQLKENSSVSTIQHSAPFGHPYVLNATLQNSLTYFDNTSENFRNVIVMGCSAISFNNYKYPRGQLLHSFGGMEPKLHQLPLFGHTADARPVIYHKPYDIEAVMDIKKRLQQLLSTKDITQEQMITVNNVFDSVYGSPHALSCEDYHDQLTVTNYYLFKNLFSSLKGTMPNLVFLSQEYIALRLLTEHHLLNNTPIRRILFDKSYQNLLVKHFDGLSGAFSQKDKYGTYLFWGFPEQGKYRTQLWKKGNYLVSDDGSYKVEFEPESIYNAIEKHELIPNTMLTFTLLAFYYGLFLGGGPAQTLNLTKMKDAYIAMQQEAGDTESLEVCSDLVTTNFIVSRPSLAYIETTKDERIPATYLDLLLYADMGKWPEVFEATKHITLDEIMNRILPSFYAEFVPASNKEEIMSQITERDIEKLTGLDKKIPSLANIKPRQ